MSSLHPRLSMALHGELWVRRARKRNLPLLLSAATASHPCELWTRLVRAIIIKGTHWNDVAGLMHVWLARSCRCGCGGYHA